LIINGEKRKIAMEIAYILMLMSAAMGDLKVFSVSQTRMMKAISLFIVVMAAAYLFISGRLERVKTAASFVGVYGFVLIGIIVWSIFLWIINIESIDFILRGASKFMYQFLVLLIIFSGAYLFGERAIFTTFYGLAAANMLMVVYNLGVYGISDSINSVIAMLMGSDAQEGFARAMEIHDITFTYGFFIIYLLFFAQHTKERILCLLVSIFFFILGWKRIALLALPVALFFGLIMGRMKPNRRIGFMKFIGWCAVIISFGYVVVTKTGAFEYITNYFGIDTMGRNDVYKYIEKYYQISLGFMGYGFEYTTVILQKIMVDNPNAHIGVVALHNNILTIYIELGFLGFWAWMIYTWVFQVNWMINHWGEKTGMLFFLCEMYIFITYTTDNTGHFGLAAKYYTHFTSPIRRYPDLQIHRIIKENLRGRLNENRIEHYDKILPEVAKQCSDRERLAEETEREVVKMKKAEYMRMHIGEEYEGVISGVTKWGIYVELPNTVEGLVHVVDLRDDHYNFIEQTYEMVGEHTGKTYKLGEKVRVRVSDADKLLRTINFELA